MRLWKVKAGMRPGRGPELGERVFVRSQASVGKGYEHQEPHRIPHVPETCMPQGRKRGNPTDNLFLQLAQLLSQLSPLQVEGPSGPSDCGGWGGGTCVPREKWMWVKERVSFPSTGERRGVSPSAPQTAFLPGASERVRLLYEGKSSDQWTHATEFVQTTP